MKNDISRREFLKMTTAVGLAGLVDPGFVFGRDLDESHLKITPEYITNNLGKTIPGCDFLTWGKATTNEFKDGVYIPKVPIISNIINTAAEFESFVLSRLETLGIPYSDITITNLYRTLERDLELSPNKKSARFHPLGYAVDFKVKGFSSKELYDVLDSDWTGGLGKYKGTTMVHWDRRDTKTRWG